MDLTRSVQRRALFRGVAGGVVAGLAFAVGGLVRAAAAKATKKAAQYQDQPMDIRSCATCSLFDAPKSCKVVEGEVSPKGWCNLYSLAD